MKAVIINRFVRNYNEIRISDLPTPTAKDDEILIRVHAAGVNFVDSLYARGLHQNNRRHVKPPFTLGLEFSGEVISAPPSSVYRPGDRVFGSYPGSYCQYLTIPCPSASGLSPSRTPSAPKAPPLFPVPRGWTHAQAATLGATLPVAYGALILRGGLRPGETVLIHAAAGGLGLAAVQIAVALGCRVLGTAGSARKCEVAKKFGCHECIDYVNNPRWWEEVNEMTKSEAAEPGMDLVFDTVGLVGDSLRCLKHYGRVLIVGFAGREENTDSDKKGLEAVQTNRVLLKQAALIGYRFGETDRRDSQETTRIWKELRLLIDSGQIKPIVYSDRQYHGLEDVPQALEDLDARKIWGKAVINVDHGGCDAKARI